MVFVCGWYVCICVVVCVCMCVCVCMHVYISCGVWCGHDIIGVIARITAWWALKGISTRSGHNCTHWIAIANAFGHRHCRKGEERGGGWVQMGRRVGADGEEGACRGEEVGADGEEGGCRWGGGWVQMGRRVHTEGRRVGADGEEGGYRWGGG